MKQKKIFYGVLAALTVLLLVSCMAAPAAAESGNDGNIHWDLTGGTLTISGTGPMPSYSYTSWNRPPWYSYRDSITRIVIKSGITEIRSYAFADCSNVVYSVSIPSSVTYIGISAFSGSSLPSIIFPYDSQLKKIDQTAFYGSGLASISLPSSVTSIGNQAFHKCKSLTSVTFPSTGQIEISTEAFYDCSSLTTLTIPSSVKSIGWNAFKGCSSLRSVTILGNPSISNSGAFFNLAENSVIYCDKTTADEQYFGYSTQYTALAAKNANGSYTFNSKVTNLALSAANAPSGIGHYGGWYKEPTFINQVTSIAANTNPTLWLKTEILVTSISVSGSTQVTEGSSINLSATVYPTTATNKGVTWKSSNTNIATVSSTGKVTGVSQGSVTITATAADRSGVKGTKTITVVPKTIKVTEITISGIDTLSIGNTSTLSALVMPTDATNKLVTWSSSDPAIASIDSNGLVTGLKEGTVTITAAAKDGSNVKGTKIIEIVPQPAVYSITVTSSTGGSASASASSAAEGTEITLTATPDTDYIFKEWQVVEGGVTVTGNKFIMPAEDVEVNAVFEADGSSPAVTASGKAGDLTWVLYDDGKLVISGNGKMPDYSYPDYGPWYSYCDSITSVVIENGVTNIGAYAFSGCSSLSSITLPSSVTGIGEGAFSSCSSLTSIVIPSGVTGIGEGAFCDCSSLTSITIPDSVTSIGMFAFDLCSGLTSVLFADGSQLTSIGYRAFEGCSSLPSITIPDSVTSIGEEAFHGCRSLTSIVIPSGVTSIGYATFCGCRSLSSVMIPSGVITIGFEAFWNCSSLTSITIPDSVTSIGSGAFYGCSSLTSITIPSSVTSISSQAFEGCSSLRSVTIPSGVTRIGDNAFFGCSSLESITIPSGVTSIGTSAFSGCSSLESIAIPSGITSIGEGMFSGCSSLTSIDIPSSVTSIGQYAFGNCISLTSLTIPSSVTSIGNYAFSGCSSLSSITIPSSVTSIGDYAFGNCSNLTSVDIPSSVTSIGEEAFSGCSSLTSIDIPSSVTSIGSGAFYHCSSLTSIVIPSGVTSIGLNVFSGCSSLCSITLPSGVTSIGYGTFSSIATNSIIYCTDVSLLSGKYTTSKTALAVKNPDGSYTFTSAVTNLSLSEANAPAGVTYGGWFADKAFTTPVESIAAGTNPTLWLKTGGIIPTETYTITVTSTSGGTASASASSAASGTLITLTATPSPDYKLKEWQVVDGGVSVVNNQFTMPACNVTINAVFENILISAAKNAAKVEETTPASLPTLTVPLFTNPKSGKSIPLDDDVVVKAVIGGVEQTLPAKIVDGKVVLDNPDAAAGATGITVEFIGKKLGDSDGDGQVTVNDAVKVAQSLVNITTLTNKGEFYGDADSDGKVTVNDAVKVAQRLVNLVDVNYE